MATSANPELFIPKPKAKPPATIQMTLQSICCKSFAEITPVMANTPIGIMATVLVLMPVIFSGIIQRRMVIMKVAITIYMRQPLCTSPSMLSSIVFLLNGKK